MSDIKNEIFNLFDQGRGNHWVHFLNSITVNNIHGWTGQKLTFDYPVVAIVGGNGIGKSTFLKSAVCVYKNKSGKDFYPSKMFMSTQWDNSGLGNAEINYDIRVGNNFSQFHRWRKTKDWGYAPKKRKPDRNVYFLDISRTVPLDATAGYAKIAMQSNHELETNTDINEENLRDLSFVLGYQYSRARFTGTDIDSRKEVGLLTKDGNEFSQFHQGAGEDTILDMFKILQEIPEYSLLVIDEVENSLHPQAQRRFIQHLLKVAKSKKIQIILSTHSPYVLDELPPKARIMLLQHNEGKEIIQGVSTKYALNLIDSVNHPELYLHVEDDEAKMMLIEIMKSSSRYDEFLKKVAIQVVGAADKVNFLNTLAKENKLPYRSLSIVDGDKRETFSNCLALPGIEGLAPEKMVFENLKEKEWETLDARFGFGAGSLFKILNDAMLLPNHHDWTTYVGDQTKKSKDNVWEVLVSTWCKNCLLEEERDNFILEIENALNSGH